MGKLLLQVLVQFNVCGRCHRPGAYPALPGTAAFQDAGASAALRLDLWLHPERLRKHFR